MLMTDENDKVLQFLQEKLVGKLRLLRQSRGEMRKKAYKESQKRWPIVMIVKIERRWQTLWPGIPEKRVQVHGFKIQYLHKRKGKVQISTTGFDRAKWIFKHFPRVPEKVLACQIS